jgi:hypothetical protein
MRKKINKIVLVFPLSIALFFSGVFCCCVNTAVAETIKAQEHSCCPLPKSERVPEHKEECECHIAIKSVAAKRAEFLRPDYKVLVCGFQNLSILPVPDVALDQLSSVYLPCSVDPPIYIRNSVYRL